MNGCGFSEGTVKIQGMVRDETTLQGIPQKNIIVQGRISRDDKQYTIDDGQFSTDSAGHFTYELRKIKDVRYYDFCFVGDSDYAFRTRLLGLWEIEQNAKFLSFSLNKLADLTIRIYRKSTSPSSDTLSLTWQTDGIYGRFVHPYKIINYGKTNKSTGIQALELRWIGGYVNSEINTKVFAGKLTRLRWDLDRYGSRKEYIDTITCKRDIVNHIYFSY